MRLKMERKLNGKSKSSCSDEVTVLKYRSSKKWFLTVEGPPPQPVVSLCQCDVSVDRLCATLRREIRARCVKGLPRHPIDWVALLVAEGSFDREPPLFFLDLHPSIGQSPELCHLECFSVAHLNE